MKYRITTRQLDKVLKSYWRKKFENSEVREIEDWFGYFKRIEDNKLVPLVIKKNLYDDTWYYNGEKFYDDHEWLGISLEEWKESFKRFLKNEYNLEVEELM